MYDPAPAGERGRGLWGRGNPWEDFDFFVMKEFKKRVDNLINILLLYYYQNFKILIMKGMS